MDRNIERGSQMKDTVAQDNLQKTGTGDFAPASDRSALKPTALMNSERKSPDKRVKKIPKTFLVGLGVIIIIILAILTGVALFSQQRAATGDTVSVYYTGILENGTVFDSNMDSSNPIEFTIGNSTIIPGFQDAVIGMSVDETKTVTIPPSMAYGNYNPKLIQTVSRSGLIANTTFIEGKSYYIHEKTKNTYSRIKIINVTNTTISWDTNNPLSGQNLTFTIKLAGIAKNV